MGCFLVFLALFVEPNHSQVIDEAFGSRLARARSIPEQYTILRELLDVGRKDPDPAARRAALEKVKESAISLGCPYLALEAARELGRLDTTSVTPPEFIFDRAQEIWDRSNPLSETEQIAVRIDAVQMVCSVLEGAQNTLIGKQWKSRIDELQFGLIIQLKARDAKIVGYRAQYLPEYDLIWRWEDAREYFEWSATLNPGQYIAEINYGVGPPGAGTVYGISIYRANSLRPENTIPFQVESTGARGRYRCAGVALVNVPREQESRIRLHVIRPSGSQPLGQFMNIKEVAFVKILPRKR